MPPFSKAAKDLTPLGVTTLPTGGQGLSLTEKGRIPKNLVDTDAIRDAAVTEAKLSFTVATQAELDAHLADSFGRHEADQISYAGGTGLTADDVEQAIDELADEKLDIPTYGTYVPTWASTGTPPALGNGVINGAYCQIGKFVHFNIDLTPGSTSTFGTGVYGFSLPVTATHSNFPVGVAQLYDISTGNFVFALAQLLNTTHVHMQYPAAAPIGALTQVGQLLPWTWVAGDLFRIEGSYRAA